MATNNSINGIALTGDVTGSGANAITTSIASNAVSNSQLAQMAANTFKANNTAGTANAADITVANAWTLLGTIPAANLLPLGGSGVSHIGTFTYDTATASGTQAITGVGFQPSLVLAIGGGIGAATSPTNTQSVGFSNGSVNYCIFNRNAANTGQWAWSSFSFIHIFSVVGASQSATLTSFQADGFTLTWTKTGSPTGTATIGYLAFK